MAPPRTMDAINALLQAHPYRAFSIPEIALHVYGFQDKAECHATRVAIWRLRNVWGVPIASKMYRGYWYAPHLRKAVPVTDV